MISCIVLSAGFSQRFGSPKALAKLDHTSVIEHLQNMLIKSSVSEIIIVLGSHGNDIQPHIFKHKKIKYAYNKNFINGQTSSFKEGLKNISNSSLGIMLLPVDYPSVKTSTVNVLVSQFTTQPSSILIPTYKNKKGHPPIFSSELKNLFSKTDDRVGLNTVINQEKLSIDLLPVDDEGVVLTFNTVQEFASLKEIIGNR